MARSPSAEAGAIAQVLKIEGQTIGTCTEEMDSLTAKAVKPSFKDADFNNKGEKKSDMAIITNSNETSIFHLIEITKK